MSTTLKTLSFLYKAKTNSKGLAPLIFRLKYQKQVAQLSIGYFVKPKDWNQDRSQVKPSDPNHHVINQHLKHLELKSYSLFSQMFHEGEVHLSTICKSSEDTVKFVQTRFLQRFQRTKPAKSAKPCIDPLKKRPPFQTASQKYQKLHRVIRILSV